jgi:hypothetical protein
VKKDVTQKRGRMWKETEEEEDLGMAEVNREAWLLEIRNVSDESGRDKGNTFYVITAFP